MNMLLLLVSCLSLCIGTSQQQQQQQREQKEDSLRSVVPGNPGRDYPIYSTAPITSFTCQDKEIGGYYADSGAGCQSFHICGLNLHGDYAKYTFLCPNGTLFNQEYFTCDWWFNVDCERARSLADTSNAELAAARAAAES